MLFSSSRGAVLFSCGAVGKEPLRQAKGMGEREPIGHMGHHRCGTLVYSA